MNDFGVNMNNEKELKRLSKFLSLLLRHQPQIIGIELDANGWVDVEELISKMNRQGTAISRQLLDHVVEINSKKRFAFNETGTKIRASQGHSVEVALGYASKEPPDILYHGTSENAQASILQTGLEKRSRQQVHLTASRETAVQVGQRHGKPVVFKVLAGEMHRDQFQFFLSENGVWLTDRVPVQYLVLDVWTTTGI